MIFTDKQKTRTLLLITVQISVFTLLVYGANWYVNTHKVNLFNLAGTEEIKVNLNLYPVNQTPSADHHIEITPIVTSSKEPIGFMKISLSYDPNIFTFKEENIDQLTQTIEILAPAQASVSGEQATLNLVYAAKSADSPPTIPIQLPKLLFTVSESFNTVDNSSVIGLKSSESQIVFMNEQVAEIQSEAARINHESPSPTASPTITQEASPTASIK